MRQGSFPIWFNLWLRAILWMGICRGLDGCVLGLKIFEPSEENPYLCGREQCRLEGFTVHVNCCVIFVLLGDSK